MRKLLVSTNKTVGNCMCGHAEGASCTFCFLMYFIRSSANIIYSRRLKFPFWFIWCKWYEYYCERKLFIWYFKHTKFSRFSYFFILLLLGGDIEVSLGPQNTLSDFCNSKGLKIVHQNVRGILSNHHLLELFANKTVKNWCDLHIWNSY